MGSALRLPIAQPATRRGAIADARRHGCRDRRDGAARRHARCPTCDLHRPDPRCSSAAKAGPAAALIDAADERVTIPMQAPVESLNAAVTAALIVYEATPAANH